MEMPLVKITLESMRQQLIHSFSDYTEEIKGIVRRIVDQVVTKDVIEKELYEQASRVLRDEIGKAIQWSISDMLRDKQVRTSMIKSFSKVLAKHAD